MSVALSDPATPHPVPRVRQLVWPGIGAAARDLLETPGLQLTYSGRGALSLAFDEIRASIGPRRSEVVLPAFHCPTVVSPALDRGFSPVYYRIRPDLSVDWEDLLAKVGPRTAAVVVIHFFGIETDIAPICGLQQHGIRIVEDWSHSFLRCDPLGLPAGAGDYKIFSFWKLVPCGVGGGLLRRAPVTRPPLERAPWKDGVVRFKRQFECAVEQGGHPWLRSMLRAADACRQCFKSTRSAPAQIAAPADDPEAPGESYYPMDADLARCAMPGSSRRMLRSIDLAELARVRRRNYVAYGERLGRCGPLTPLWPALQDRACPWVFPVLLEGRDHIDHQWRRRGVALHTFGIHLHSSLSRAADARSVADARFLAERVLCLSVHQGLTPEHISRSAEIIRSHCVASGGERLRASVPEADGGMR